MLQAVGVLAIAAVRWAAARAAHRPLSTGAARGRAASSRYGTCRAHLHVVGLEDHATLLRPEALERQDQPWKEFLGSICAGRSAILVPSESGRNLGCRHARVNRADRTGLDQARSSSRIASATVCNGCALRACCRHCRCAGWWCAPKSRGSGQSRATSARLLPAAPAFPAQ